MSFIQIIKNIFNRKQDNGFTEQKVHFAHGEDFHIDTRCISSNVRKVTKRLKQAQFEAYLVGGGVRDLLLNKNPKDFDVATDATPEQVRKLFRNSRIIGRRFRLAHVYFKNEIIEVATFRAQQSLKKAKRHTSEHGMVLRDNNYGDLQQDAWRRDFTINALYFDLQQDLIVDYTGGLEDIKNSTLRIIGDSQQRYREDPVRMLRALRFSAKLGLKIAPDTIAPLTELKHLIWNVPQARIYEELLKFFFTGHALQSYQQLKQQGFTELLLPQTDTIANKNKDFQQLIHQVLVNTDQRINQGKTINPAFLFAAILWGPLQQELKPFTKNRRKVLSALQRVSEEIIGKQVKTIAIPRRITHTMKQIWELQYRLPNRNGKRAFQTLGLERFRAGYDFLLLRSQVDKNLKPLAEWWTKFQTLEQTQQEEMIGTLPKPSQKKH